MAKSQPHDYKFVVIHSQIDIRVSPKLIAKDVTKVDSDIKDRLVIKPTWPKAGVLIRKGQGYYPNCIKDWAAVKAFIEKGMMSIAGECDNIGELGKSEVADITGKLVDKETNAITKAFREANAELVEKSPLEEIAE